MTGEEQDGLLQVQEQELPERRRPNQKLVLIGTALLIAAAIGGWYVLTQNTPAVTDLSSGGDLPVTSTSAGTTTGTAAGTTTAGTPPRLHFRKGPVTSGTENTGTGSTVNTVNTAATTGAPTSSTPAGTVTPSAGANTTESSSAPAAVATVPMLNPSGSAATGTASQGTGQGTAQGTAAPTAVTDPLSIQPNLNPFKPLRVIANVAGGDAPTVTTATVGNATGTGGNGTGGTGVRTPASTATVNLSGAGGAIPLPSVSVGGLPTTATASGSTGTGNASSGGATLTPGGTVSLGTGGAIPLPTISLNGVGTTTGQGGTVTTGQGTTGQGTVTPSKPKPLPVPVLTLAQPALASVSGMIPSSSAQGSKPGTPDLNLGQPALEALQRQQPSVIDRFGFMNVPTLPQTDASRLDQLISDRQLRFTALILGAVNTAIFASTDGYAVVTTGSTLENSSVVLEAVTATSATLRLGTQTKVLTLDRSDDAGTVNESGTGTLPATQGTIIPNTTPVTGTGSPSTSGTATPTPTGGSTAPNTQTPDTTKGAP